MNASRRKAIDARVVELIAEANGHDVSAQLRIGLTSDLVRAAAPDRYRSTLGRYETGLRAVVTALANTRPRPRSMGPRRCIIWLTLPRDNAAEAPARIRLVAHHQQVKIAAWHLDQADRLYWQAAVLAASTLLTKTRLRQLGGEMDDARQEGMIALDTAARRYNPDMGRWRRHAIGWLMSRNRDRKVKLSQGAITTHGYEVRSRARKVQERARAAGYELSLEELAREVRSTPEYLEQVLSARAPAAILDAPAGDEEGATTRGELLVDEEGETRQEAQETALDVANLLALMPPREAWVTARLAGLWGTEARTEQELAQEMDWPVRSIDRLHRRGKRFARGLLRSSAALGPKGVELLRAAVLSVDAGDPAEAPSTQALPIQALMRSIAPALLHSPDASMDTPTSTDSTTTLAAIA